MKKSVKRCFSFIVLSVFMIILSVSAFAALNDFQVGEYSRWCIAQEPPTGEPGSTFVSCEIISGSCPGLSVWNTADACWIGGTPTASGSFPLTVLETYADGNTWTDQLTVTVAPAKEAETVFCSMNFTEKVNGSFETACCSSMIQTYSISGNLPAGLSYEVYDCYIRVFGTSTVLGATNVIFNCETEGGSACFNITVNVLPAPKPRRITQQPMSVTVEEGRECSFSANAEGNGWCAWRFYKPDGTEVIFDRLKSLGEPYNQVILTGGNDLSFTVKNIPLAMDGWTVACLFARADTADNRPYAYTEKAKITVTPVSTPTPEPTPAPTPDSLPLSEPPAVPTAAPTAAPAASSLPDFAPTAVPTEAPVPGQPSNTLLKVTCGALAVALCCSLALLIIRGKKK